MSAGCLVGCEPSLAETPVPEFQLKLVPAGRTLLGTVLGPLDLQSAPELTARLDSAGSDWRRVVLDLRATEYIDSAGVRALLQIRKQLDQRGVDFRLAIRPASRVERVLHLLQLESQFHIYDHISDAWLDREAVA